MPYKLYWHPGSSSLAPMALLKEIGANYEAILVDLEAGENFGSEYLRIHPYGRVPALELPDGSSVFESAGLVLHLADQVTDGRLVPEIGEADRARCYQWLFFLADTIYPSYNRLAHPERYVADDSAQDLIKENAMALLTEQWDVLEKRLAERRWLLGDRFSCADIYLVMVTTWDFAPESFAARCPNVVRVAHAAARRPAVQYALERHTAPLPK